ncbi:hypothetical protein KY343_03940 [Candidatus Woesearchaeota archaeon]|nr:hypothetical protein [Candidatus Woesearchaeota archaeon]
MTKYQSNPTKEQFMRDCLTDADRCARNLDRGGTLNYLKAAMRVVGYDLDETFERQIGILYFNGGKELHRQCIELGSRDTPKIVPGWNGAATALREHIKENGVTYIQLYYRIRKLIEDFNERIENRGAYYECSTISLDDVKKFGEKIPESELETKLDDKAVTKRTIRPRCRIEGDWITIDFGGLSPA